jgi:beta-barrel assembly-enhancing protease
VDSEDFLSVFRSHGLVLVAVSGLVMAGSQAQAQDQPAEPVPAAKPAGGVSGFFSGLGQSITNVVSGNREKPQILELVPGVYQKSNESIGEDRDIDENRITRGLLSLPSFTQYANTVLDKLKLASGVQQVPGKVLVVANDQMDAGATADGNVFISSGYIRELKNEDQLAALLAHELAHVLLKHHDSNAFTRIQKQVSTLLQTGMGIRNSLDKASGGTASNTLSPPQKELIQKMELLIKVSDGALSPAWGRRQEAEADRLGMDLMVKAGYSYQEGFIPWLEAVAKWDALQDAKKAAEAVKQEALMQSMLAGGKFDDTLKQGLGFALNDVKSQLSASHEGGEKRISDIDAYFIKAYNEKVPQVAATVRPYEQARNQPDVRPVITAYSQVFQARSLIGDQKYSDAQALLKPLLEARSPLAGHALPNQLMFEATRAMGRKKEAELFLSKSLSSDNSVWEVYDSAATYYKDNGDLGAITKVGQGAFQRFSGAPSAYPKLIALYRRNGLTKEMNSVLSECVLKQADKRDQCVDAAK